MPYRAKQSFRTAGRRFVTAGTVVADDDPVLEDGRDVLFEKVDDTVERATAAPGEKRTVKKTTKKKATDDS